MFARQLLWIWMGVLCLRCSTALAQEAYFSVPIGDLKIVEGELPRGERDFAQVWTARAKAAAMTPYAVVEGGEAYLGGGAPERFGFVPALEVRPDTRLNVRAPAGRDVEGVLHVANADLSGMVAIRFHIAAGAADPQARPAFLESKLAHYRALAARDVPGAAWFRYQASQVASELGVRAGDEPRQQWRPAQGLDDTYALFTGGRAVSENLQLDRVLRLAGAGAEATIDIDTIAGITVREMDLRSKLAEHRPQLDPLAAAVPADQHAVFFPTFAAFIAAADAADEQGTPILRLVEVRSEDARTKARYERQLCLSLSGLGRLLGPQVIDSVVLTGSDAYLRVGSDLAVLFEAKDPVALRALLAAQIALGRQASADAAAVRGEIAGVAYSGAVSPDRVVCSYLAALGNTVVVTNSLVQLQRLVDVHQGRRPSLASLAEYQFFRARYRRGEEETGLLVLSDAAIRRWCSPHWRIADSRRTRAAAVMTDLQARHLNELARNQAAPAVLKSSWSVPDAGELRLTSAGVVSSVYGRLDFMTPIVELSLEKVTKEEAEAYRRWRDTYQQNWQWAFDPIAMRFSIQEGRLSADLTVMPLIWGSEYRQMVETSLGAALGPTSADPHEALAHLSVAINPQSRPIQQIGNLLQGLIPEVKLNVLSWLGKSVALYADADPFWEELATAESAERYIEQNLGRLPIAAHVEVADQFRLGLFLTALRLAVATTAPEMLVWENRTHNQRAYVRVSASEKGQEAIGAEVKQLAIYYGVAGNGLLITPNEEVLKRYIDRQLAIGLAATRPGGAPPPQHSPLLGESYNLTVDGRFAALLAKFWGGDYQAAMQARAWANLPILNEWRRLYPDQDPLSLHQRLWHARLVCPGGGRYVWNERWKSMESTVYGLPAAPKDGPPLPPALTSLSRAVLGLTFEEDGLRARTRIERQDR